MPKALSADLRKRIVDSISGGRSRRAAAIRFRVAPSTAVRLASRFEETGSIAPKRLGRLPGSGKLGPHADFIIGHVEARPDITMPELAELLEAERGVRVDPSNLSKFLCKAGFSYKKNAAGIGKRTR